MAACLSWKERPKIMKQFRRNKKKQSMDYKDDLYKKEQQQKQRKLRQRPQPGIVINNYNSVDSIHNTNNTNNTNQTYSQNTTECDSMYQTQELVPISSLTSTP